MEKVFLSEQRHAKLADRWPHQRRALQLGVKFAIFIKDCKQIIQQLKVWGNAILEMFIVIGVLSDIRFFSWMGGGGGYDNCTLIIEL